jgi:hypothetical protein
MMLIKQSTSIDVPVGPFLDDTDGKTAETALTITQPDVRLKKNGAAWAQKAAAQTLTHEENGWYEVTLDATDTDTLGHLVVAIHESGALPVWREFQVVPAAVYDGLVSGSGNGVRADVQAIAANAITATAIATDAITAAKIAADAITAAKIADGAIDAATFAAAAINAAAIAADAITAAKVAADVTTEIQSGLSTLDAAGVRSAVGLAAANLDTQLTAIDDFLDTEIAAIKAKTDNLPATPAAAGDQMALTAAAIDAILDDAMEGTLTVRQALRIILAAAAGKLAGAATTSVTVRDQADTKNRISATVDADGNRSAVTVDGT